MVATQTLIRCGSRVGDFHCERPLGHVGWHQEGETRWVSTIGTTLVEDVDLDGYGGDAA